MRRTLGEPAKVVAFARSFLQPLDDDEARAYLGSHAGRAWANASSGGRVGLTLRDDGMCTVHAPRVDVTTLRAAFSALLPIAQPDRAVESLPLSVSNQPQGELEHSAYVVSALAGARDARELYTAVISTSRSARAPMQAVMTLWPR
ncbi:MAG: hypothetical protein ABIU95_03205 [Burkholderiales bacterium]